VFKQPQQADDEIHEDQLLNFLVNSLDEEVAPHSLKTPNSMLKTSTRVLVGACADGTSVSTLCERSEDAPHENSVLYHLRTKFDLETLEQVGNARSSRRTFLTSSPAGGGLRRPPPAGLLWRRR